MGRVINSNSPGKIRYHHQRTIAELLRRLSQQQALDQETKDMAAAITYSLRGIHETVMQTVQAWEKRDYWTKADRFMREWEWADHMAADLEDLIYQSQWSRLPGIMASLMPHFIQIETKKLTRPRSHWLGAHQRLLMDKAKSAD